jgi:hypothetical protein
MSGGLGFVVRTLCHVGCAVLFPSVLSILREHGRAALDRRGPLEMTVLPFLLLWSFRCEDCAKRRYNFFFTRALHEPETNFLQDACGACHPAQFRT